MLLSLSLESKKMTSSIRWGSFSSKLCQSCKELTIEATVLIFYTSPYCDFNFPFALIFANLRINRVLGKTLNVSI